MAFKDRNKTPYVDQFKSYEWGLTRCLKIPKPFILFHGGLGDQLESRGEIQDSLEKIAGKVQSHLKKAAVDLAQLTVSELEDDPIFNAGFGAKLQADGVSRLSSAIMDGHLQKIASVSNILSQRHPSAIAKHLLGKTDRNLSAVEATRYALAHGFPPEKVQTERRILEWRQKISGKTGTVGAIAIDIKGRTAACTSTGGRGNETPGRISDSFTPAGNFATPFGAVSCTGVGEEILDAAAASSALIRVEDGFSLSEAIAKTFARHKEKRFGMIALDDKGNAIVYATRGALAFGLVTPHQIFTGLLPEDWERCGIILKESMHERNSSSNAKGFRRNF